MKNYKLDLLLSSLILFFALFLRLGGQKHFPPGFSPDEGAFAYDSYSILKTGKDQYGNFLPVVFKSFGDYKAPLYFYLCAISEYIFGFSKIGVRMPSILLGSLTTVLIYLFTMMIWGRRLLSLTASLLLATSPWHLLQSRFTSESVITAFFLFSGILLLFFWFRKKRLWLLSLSSICFVLSVYSYHSARLTALLLLITICYLYWQTLKRKLKQLFLAFIFGILLILPLPVVLINRYEEIMRRPMAISIFTDEGLGHKIWLLTHVTTDQNIPVILTRFFNNKVSIYTMESVRRWLHHFSLEYLFINGDPFDRFQTPYAGLVSLFALPFFLWGLKIILSDPKRESIFVLAWIGISPIVSSLAVFTPNSLHTLDSVIPFQIVTGLGLVNFLTKFKGKLIQNIVLFLIIFIFLIPFIYSYLFIIPHNSKYSIYWWYGFDEVMENVNKLEKNYDKIFFFGAANFDLAAFYQKYPPEKFQKEFVYKVAQDKKLYDRVESYGKYFFPENEEKIFELEKSNLVVFGGEFAKRLKISKKDNLIFYNSDRIKNRPFKIHKIILSQEGKINYALGQP